MPSSTTFLQQQSVAILIGPNYVGTDYQLSGCLNDILQIKSLLTAQGVSRFFTLSDSGAPDMVWPSQKNVFAIMNQVVAMTKTTPRLKIYFYYSGHGMRQGTQEAILAVDESRNIQPILGYKIHTDFLQRLPASATVVSVFDCCHSGTVLDLAYQFTVIQQRVIPHPVQIRYNNIRATVLTLSACSDQALAYESNGQGALTGAVVRILSLPDARRITMSTLLLMATAQLKTNNFLQDPELSSTKGNVRNFLFL